MKDFLDKQLKKIEKKEKRVLRIKKEPLKEITSPVIETISEKIPKKTRELIEKAFYKAFEIVFEKGDIVIEKTYSKEKMEVEHDINNYAFERRRDGKSFKEVSRRADKSVAVLSGISALEGAGLGFFGIGIPDIPIFIGVLLKGIYEIASGYGFSYNSENERYFILNIIEAAVLEGKDRVYADEGVNELIEILENRKQGLKFNTEKQMKATGKALADDMLFVKAVQGLPLIGAVGGVFNMAYCGKVLSYARLKYKKRYLLGKLKQRR